MRASGSAYQPGIMGLPECGVCVVGDGGEGGECDGGQLLPPPMMIDYDCVILISCKDS